MTKAYIEEGRLCRSVTLCQPYCPVLVTTMNANGTVNVAPFSWVTPISMEPPMLALALGTLRKKQHTLTNIEREGEFVVNLPEIDLAEQIVRVAYNYPEGPDKFTIGGFTPHPSTQVRPPGVAECRAHLECRLNSARLTGDHTLVVGDVVAASYDEEKFDYDFKLRLDRSRPCIHLRHFRRAAGQTHAFAHPLGELVISVPYGTGIPDVALMAGDQALPERDLTLE